MANKVAGNGDLRDLRDVQEQAVSNVMVLALAIAEHSQGRAGHGRLPCPVCKTGTLEYAIVAHRAVAIRCSTDGCLAYLA